MEGIHSNLDFYPVWIREFTCSNVCTLSEVHAHGNPDLVLEGGNEFVEFWRDDIQDVISVLACYNIVITVHPMAKGKSYLQTMNGSFPPEPLLRWHLWCSMTSSRTSVATCVRRSPSSPASQLNKSSTQRPRERNSGIASRMTSFQTVNCSESMKMLWSLSTNLLSLALETYVVNDEVSAGSRWGISSANCVGCA